ncbi:MAG: phosphoribosylanthranilate isomerase [Gemmatimonadales bacterium]
MTKIKFCGMTRARDAALAVELGASHIGVIFAESSRRVTVEQAREVFATSADARRVGVFGRAGISSEEVIRHAKELGLDVLQLHGGFLPEDVVRLRDDFDGELWTVIPVDQRAAVLPDGWDKLADVSDALLIDTSVRGVTGGTGTAFDWKAAAPEIRRAAAQIPIVLAGGLNAENVGEAIAILHPGTVDVSSGIESAPGIKDPARMRAFADAVVSASIVW